MVRLEFVVDFSEWRGLVHLLAIEYVVAEFHVVSYPVRTARMLVNVFRVGNGKMYHDGYEGVDFPLLKYRLP